MASIKDVLSGIIEKSISINSLKGYASLSGDNIFNGDNAFSGDVTISGNLTVNDIIANDISLSGISETYEDILSSINVIGNSITGIINSFPIGTIFYCASTEPPDGAFLLNGQIIYNCSSLYPEFYNYINTNSGIRKVTSVEYESEISSIGMCGGFVVDAENGSIRLPNITSGFIEGSNGNNVGDVISAGLPNITGSSHVSFRTINAATDPEGKGAGAIRCYNSGKNVPDAGNTFYDSKISFDASLSNSIYGNSNTVQPKSVCYSICIQVFNSTINISAQNSAHLTTELQSKVGVNADNFTAAGKNKIIDDIYKLDEYITVSAVNTWYQAERDGILIATYINTSASPVNCYLKYSWNMVNTVLATGLHVNGNNGNATFNLFVPKGAYYQISTDNASVVSLGRKVFFPLYNSISNS